MTDEQITAVLGTGWRKANTADTDTLRELKQSDAHAAACAGKVKHATEGAAMAEARQSSAYLVAYRCKHCNSYHVGKNKERHKITINRKKRKVSN